MLKVKAQPIAIDNVVLREHYRELFTVKGNGIAQECMSQSLAVQPVFDKADISIAISRLKHHKAAIPTLFSPQLLKYFVGDEHGEFATCLTALFNTFAMKGLPLEWNRTVITSLYKAGDQ